MPGVKVSSFVCMSWGSCTYLVAPLQIDELSQHPLVVLLEPLQLVEGVGRGPDRLMMLEPPVRIGLVGTVNGGAHGVDRGDARGGGAFSEKRGLFFRDCY